jgi:hypothetical protein
MILQCNLHFSKKKNQSMYLWRFHSAACEHNGMARGVEESVSKPSESWPVGWVAALDSRCGSTEVSECRFGSIRESEHSMCCAWEGGNGSIRVTESRSVRASEHRTVGKLKCRSVGGCSVGESVRIGSVSECQSEGAIALVSLWESRSV